MGRNLPEGISPELIAEARENVSGESAWQYPAILQVTTALATRGYATLGGDVMHVDETGTLDNYHGDLYCGNWYLNRRSEQSWAEYGEESIAATQGYIEAYVQRNGDEFWFVPVFIDQAGYANLRLRSGRDIEV